MVSSGLVWSPERHKYDTSFERSTAASTQCSERGAHEDACGLSSPDTITQGLGTPDCHRFRSQFFRKHSEISWDIARYYVRTCEQQSHIEANRALLTLDSALEISGLHLSWSDAKLKSFAENRANECRRFNTPSKTTESALELSLNILKRYELKSPDQKEAEAQYSRLCSNQWWLKRIRRKKLETIESTARDIGLVKKAMGGYCSNIGLRERRFQKQRNQDLLESTFYRDEEGNELSLAEVSKHTIANPAIRRTELMTRLRGLEEVADLYGDCAEFYTITCPSRFHAYHSKSGQRNAKFNSSSIKEANNYLCGQWALIRSALNRNNIFPYGFRVAEPHQDGTPHWHTLLFVEPEKRQQMREICKRYALQDSPNEPGAKLHRFKAESIDPKKGSATGYIAKYISKNIDGEHIEKDLYGMDAKSSAERIEAWASLNGIRQFQPIGAPSVTVWRELRRLREQHDDPTIEAARQAADSSDFAAYVIAMGGVHLKRKLRPIQTLYEAPEHIDINTGEITQRMNQFGELSVPRVIGLITADLEVKTRTRKWHRLTKTKPLSGGGIVEGAAPPTPPPRSGLGLV